jgi:hypothetical protein
MNKTIEDLDYELRCKVNTWIDSTFNFILVDVLELVAEKQGTYLGEFIKQPSLLEVLESAAEQIEDFYVLLKEFKKSEEEIDLEELNESELVQFYDYLFGKGYARTLEEIKNNPDNYPLHGTCFEIRESPDSWTSRQIIANAEKADLGVISDLEYFNSLLFISGSGYNFYRAHWIPLYLLCYEEEKEKYKDLAADYFRAYQ